MMWCLSGTPGTGKSSVAALLKERGYRVVQQNDTVAGFVLEDDPERDTKVIDVDAWASAFTPVDGIVEGHLTHYLSCDGIVVLRCRPDLLIERLRERGYGEGKVMENAEAEALDVILIEALENHPPDKIYELDCTELSVRETADMIEGFMKGKIPSSHGNTDWTEFLGLII